MIWIDDMDMPEKCSECRMQTDYEFCAAMPKNFCGNTKDDGKPDWCPLRGSRVLSLEELGNYKKPVWIEERESPKASKWYAPFKEIDTGIYVVFGEWCFMVEDYNIKWRPWTDVPTEEQREVVKWNG